MLVEVSISITDNNCSCTKSPVEVQGTRVGRGNVLEPAELHRHIILYH